MIELSKVSKWFGTFQALKEVDLSVARGEKVVVCGPSGSGKSTLIRLVNGLESYQSGQVTVDGIALDDDPRTIDRVRREVGMVFQTFNLFPHLTVLENLTLAPIWVQQVPKKEAEETAMHFLGRVRIPEQAAKYPSQLSGGQQQRVAIARALVNDPKLILADEPTGALDSATSLEVMALLQALNREGITIVLVTHEHDIAEYASRTITFRDGHVVTDLRHAPRLASDDVAAVPTGSVPSGPERARAPADASVWQRPR